MENDYRRSLCVRCGARLETGSLGYIDKLIKALGHPEPETVQRALWVLGELRSSEAVIPVINLLRTSRDMGVLERGVEALAKIRDERSLEVLLFLAVSSYLTVSLKAVEAINDIGGRLAAGMLEQVMKKSASSSVSRRAGELLSRLHISEKVV